MPLDRRTQMAPSSFSNVLSGIYVMVNIWLKVALSKFQCGIIFEQSIPLHLPDKDNWNNPYCKYMERVQKLSSIESIYWYK